MKKILLIACALLVGSFTMQAQADAEAVAKKAKTTQADATTSKAKVTTQASSDVKNGVSQGFKQ